MKRVKFLNESQSIDLPRCGKELGRQTIRQRSALCLPELPTAKRLKVGHTAVEFCTVIADLMKYDWTPPVQLRRSNESVKRLFSWFPLSMTERESSSPLTHQGLVC
jgi:hypothetical protein